ncbi:MAG: UTP--glucose-1-phosphate uridylyltransferase [Clostridia bacterium]|nr:UTP--glucose-1-phosphate uridylyltransferase [Clostridia bacterium]
MQVKKAVIPCAGMGTRFLPFTKAMPKEMIPIVDTPTLQYIVKEVVDSGITDILIINNSQKTAIERHFSSANEEVELLLSRGKEREAKIISEISNLANISFVHQEFPSGSAGAVMLAKEFVNGEPFTLLFGDDLIDSKVPAVKQLIDAYDKYGKTVLGVQPVLKENISKYGSISIVKQEGKVYFIDDVIEKPKTEEAPSLIAALGRYIVSPEVFDYIDKTPTVKHEVGITDTFRLMTKDGLCIACEYEGRRYDTGNKSSYLEAVVDYALKDEELKDGFAEFLKKTVERL